LENQFISLLTFVAHSWYQVSLKAKYNER